MLPGLNNLEIGRLRMSVGYGHHKAGRLLSPIEVGELFQRAIANGSSIAQCAIVINIDSTNVKRFLKIMDLPHDLHHLVSWGSPKDAIGFTCAYELVRIDSEDNQRAVVGAILADGLNSKGVRQVAQLLDRSKRSVGECLKEVIGMRTTFDKRYIFIGGISDLIIQNSLINMSQRERDELLAVGAKKIGLVGASGRLGSKLFTMVGDERFGDSVQKIGKEDIENLIRMHIARSIDGNS